MAKSAKYWRKKAAVGFLNTFWHQRRRGSKIAQTCIYDPFGTVQVDQFASQSASWRRRDRRMGATWFSFYFQKTQQQEGQLETRSGI